MIIAPSILACPKDQIQQGIEKINQTQALFIHVDIMDGKFVPNYSFDEGIVKLIRPLTNKILDVHLMIESPHLTYQQYAEAGADYITFHYESLSNAADLIEEISGKYPQVKIGLSIKPKTPIEVIMPYLNRLALVLIMSVEPGFGGQTFIDEVIPKIVALKSYRDEKKLSFLISVDGGINEETYKKVLPSVDVVVAGTYLFKQKDMNETIVKMMEEKNVK